MPYKATFGLTAAGGTSLVGADIVADQLPADTVSKLEATPVPALAQTGISIALYLAVIFFLLFVGFVLVHFSARLSRQLKGD